MAYCIEMANKENPPTWVSQFLVDLETNVIK